MPVHNVEKYVGTAIESILCQTFEDFQLLIIDDASTDHTVDIISQYKDNRIRCIKNKINIGIASSLNKGLTMTNSPYVARMDGDDISESTRFEKQLAYMKANPNLSILGSHMKLIDENGNVLKVQPKEIGYTNIKLGLFFGRTSLAHPSLLIRKSQLDKYHLRYDSAFAYAEDYDLYCRACHYLELDNYPEYFIQYRIHSDSVSQKFHERQILDAKMALYLHLQRLKFPINRQNFHTHSLLSFHPSIWTDDMLYDVIQWIKYLITWNKETQMFPHVLFCEYCNKIFSEIKQRSEML